MLSEIGDYISSSEGFIQRGLLIGMEKIIIILVGITLALSSCHSHKAVTSGDGYSSDYTIVDQEYGTNTKATIKDDQRIIVTNALPNHSTGEFPNAGNPNTIQAQNRTYKLPLHPKYIGESQWVREPGVAINGVKFEPGTAEVVQCESGENYRVEGIQKLIDLGLDNNHAHVQPTGAYHYHGTPTGLVESEGSDKDLVHVGFAMDGFLIYYSRSGAYTPSYKLIDENREGTDCLYENPHTKMNIELEDTTPDGTYTPDWEYVKGLGDLDECNGVMIDDQYVYLITDDYPYIGRCLMGEYEEPRRGPRPEGGRPPRGPRGN